jgi:teichuronic acid exporter
MPNTKILPAALALLLGRGAGQMLSLGLSLLMVRLLAPAAFGDYALVMVTVGLAGMVADLGLDTGITRAFAQAEPTACPHQTELGAAIGYRLAASWLFCLALPLLASFLPWLGRPQLLFLAALSLPPRAVYRSHCAALIGVGRAAQAAQIEGLTGLVASLFAVGALALGPWLGIDTLLALVLLAAVAGNGLGQWLSQRRIGPHYRHARWAAMPSLLQRGFPFLLANLAGALFLALDLYVVRVRHPDSLPFYSAAMRVLALLLIVPSAWGAAALPSYVRGAANLQRDSMQMALLGLAMVGGCVLLAGPLTILLLGPAYAPAGALLAILSGVALPVCLSAPVVAWLAANNRQGWITACVTLCGVWAVIINVIAGGQVESVALVKVLAMLLLAIGYGLGWWRNHQTRQANPLR